jgi:hypothetical protein
VRIVVGVLAFAEEVERDPEEVGPADRELE